MRKRSRESGYALLMALFLTMAMIIGSQVVLSNMATQGRRQRETETIWRGNQYVRAIRLYYRKTGHYPQSIDDLQKGLPGLHFLRIEAYNDPINKDDGAWRLIYVNAAGQIIGSVRYATLQQMALMDLNGGKMPTAQTGLGSASATDQAPSTGASSQSSSPQPGTQQGQQTPAQLPSQGISGSAQGTSPMGGANTLNLSTSPSTGTDQSLNAIAQLKPTGPVDGPVLGGFVTGVASKIDRPSVRVYKGGTTYQQWEFIWNPLEDQARAMQNGLAPQGQLGLPGLPIANPNGGGTTTAPTNPPAGNGPGAPQQAPPDQPLVQ